ncbi:hypothetical protein Ddye_022056 [Dipteronia dyeriana]|uniref:F-box associated beta-propeller type 1 domain-containing protein n=1 Tax=Dipteronia dyeriana TaxID=168575 RepID=A0AAD9WXG4_9ROSI|nr:hypothetical protein Ddye_022056 [Dipteronia dyeriana]
MVSSEVGYASGSGYASGFGYDHSTDDYIILRFIYNKSEQAEIYSCHSDSWLQMGRLPKQFRRISQTAFFANGALYWRGVYPANMIFFEGDIFPHNSDDVLSSILCFDLVSRKFSMIVPPDELCKKHNFDLRVLGGRLCLANYDHACHFDIWAWQGNKEGYWIKLMTIPCMSELRPQNQYLVPVFFMINNGELLLKTILKHYRKTFPVEKLLPENRLFIYNQTHKTFRELEIPYAHLLPRQEITYTKSLVLPAGDAGDDRESPVYDEDARGVDIDVQTRMFELERHSRMTGEYKQEVKSEICCHILSEFAPNCKSSTSEASLQWTIELE